jgi:hypothetical protein
MTVVRRAVASRGYSAHLNRSCFFTVKVVFGFLLIIVGVLVGVRAVTTLQVTLLQFLSDTPDGPVFHLSHL